MSKNTLSTGDMAFITSSFRETTANLGRVVTVLQRAVRPANHVAIDGTKLHMAPTGEPLWWVKSDRPIASWATVDKRLVWCHERPIATSACSPSSHWRAELCLTKS